MKIILTNDDGIEAPGLRALYKALPADYRLVVVAPENPCSGFGHQVTTHAAIAVRRIDSNRFGVKGTPADCSRLALKVLAPGADWLIGLYIALGQSVELACAHTALLPSRLNIWL